MELSWIMRIRIFAALGIGIALVGFLPWSLVAPEPMGVFAFFNGNINAADIMICAGLAFLAGFLASVITMPYGAQIGILAAPAGLAVWGMRSAPLSSLFQSAPAAASRLQVYSKSGLRFEAFIWLGIALSGFAGAIIADKIFRRKPLELPDKMKPVVKLPEFAQIAVSVIATVFIATFFLNVFAVNVSYMDPQLSSVTAQPKNAQIAFAVLMAFGICGFLAKLLLSANSFWVAIASVPLIYYSTITYIKNDTIAYLSSTWPAVFFAKPVSAILPVQMVAFAFLGAVWGYWLAVRYHIWRTTQE